MKETTKIKMLLNLMILAGIFIGMCLMYFIINVQQIKTSATPTPKITEYSQCANLSTYRMADCLVNYVSTFYIYNRSNKDNNLDFEQLKSQGGVCWHWANLYKKMGTDLGAYTYRIDIKINDSMDHALNIISKNNTYCIVDQDTLVGCIKLE
jgi:hypothetical protein